MSFCFTSRVRKTRPSLPPRWGWPQATEYGGRTKKPAGTFTTAGRLNRGRRIGDPDFHPWDRRQPPGCRGDGGSGLAAIVGVNLTGQPAHECDLDHRMCASGARPRSVVVPQTSSLGLARIATDFATQFSGTGWQTEGLGWNDRNERVPNGQPSAPPQGGDDQVPL
jgi:hypothetical protein